MTSAWIRDELLRIASTQPGRTWASRTLAAHIHEQTGQYTSHGTVNNWLKKLEQEGVLTRDVQGKQFQLRLTGPGIFVLANIPRVHLARLQANLETDARMLGMSKPRLTGLEGYFNCVLELPLQGVDLGERWITLLDTHYSALDSRIIRGAKLPTPLAAAQ